MKLYGHSRPQHWNRRTTLCVVFAFFFPLLGEGALVKYCSGVKFLSDDQGVITDGAVDTGMGVYRENTDCKWVIKPNINDQVPKTAQAFASSALDSLGLR